MDRQSECSFKLAPKRARHGDERILSHLIYFFAPFSINHIPHNYVIPQAMPHAIPQTHSTFYPHRLIDLIYTNYPDKVDYSGVCNVSISDHSLVFAYRKLSIAGNRFQKTQYH